MDEVSAESAIAAEREKLASVLHDEILQGIIAARWALDDLGVEDLPGAGARALAEAIQALDQTQEAVREQITRLQGGPG